MTKRTRRNHSPDFKAKVALAAIKGDRTIEASIVVRLDCTGRNCCFAGVLGTLQPATALKDREPIQGKQVRARLAVPTREI